MSPITARPSLGCSTAGRVGETYNIGGNAERRNIDVVREICRLVDARAPRARRLCRVSRRSRSSKTGRVMTAGMQSTAGKIRRELGWAPTVSFEEGLAQDGGLVPREPGLGPAGAGSRIPRASDWDGGNESESAQGDRSRGRGGHPAASDYAGYQQAAPAGLRQADDLLPAQRADAHRHPRGPDHQHSAGAVLLQEAPRRRQPMGHAASSTRYSRRRMASRRRW